MLVDPFLCVFYYFDQQTACGAPIRWSKYTTTKATLPISACVYLWSKRNTIIRYTQSKIHVNLNQPKFETNLSLFWRTNQNNYCLQFLFIHLIMTVHIKSATIFWLIVQFSDSLKPAVKILMCHFQFETELNLFK